MLPLAAAVGGLAYAFGGFAVGQVGHLNQISAAAWLPAVLLAYDRFARSQKVYWLALGALALAMELLAGHPQETYMTLIVLGIFGVVGAPWRRPRNLVWCAIGGAGMCALGGGLSAAQLMPTLELAPLSIRGEGVNWRETHLNALTARTQVELKHAMIAAERDESVVGIILTGAGRAFSAGADMRSLLLFMSR